VCVCVCVRTFTSFVIFSQTVALLVGRQGSGHLHKDQQPANRETASSTCSARATGHNAAKHDDSARLIRLCDPGDSEMFHMKADAALIAHFFS